MTIFRFLNRFDDLGFKIKQNRSWNIVIIISLFREAIENIET